MWSVFHLHSLVMLPEWSHRNPPSWSHSAAMVELKEPIRKNYVGCHTYADHLLALNSPLRGCNSAMPKCCDSRQESRTLAVTEHVCIEAATGQTWVAVTYCHTTRGVAKRTGSKVRFSILHLLLETSRIKSVRIKHGEGSILYEGRAIVDPVV